jgi:hypothetical protein
LDLAIEFCLTFGMVFKQPLRQTQGLMRSIAGLLGVKIAVPHFTTLSRRGNGLSLVREFLNLNVSRSGLDRCLRRHGVGNLRDLKVKEAKPKHSAFKAYEPGYLHIDVKYLPHHSYGVANDCANGSSNIGDGQAFTDRLFGLRKRAATGKQGIDTRCTNEASTIV